MTEPDLTLANATLIDGTGRPPVEHAVVQIEGQDISLTGSKEEGCPDAETVLDLEGRTLMPGLIDVHVHTHAAYTEPDGHLYDLARTAMLAARRAELALESGITTLRDAGAQRGISTALKLQTEQGVIIGSRIVPCGHIIAVTGGHGWKRSGTEADGPYGLRRQVREELKAGADQIKLAVTHRAPVCEMTTEELNAAVDEAHRYDAAVACHAGLEPGIRQAVEAGVDSIEHGWLASGESIQAMASRGTYWVPTLSVLRGEIEAQQTWEDRKQRQEEMRPFLGQDERRFGESMKYFHDAWHAVERTFESMVEAGVPIAVGTDAPLGGLPIDAAANEAAWLVEFGLSPMEAVQAATRNAAEVVGLGESLGTVEPGKRADLIAVDGNPLEDIEALQNVQLVIKNGEVVHNSIS